MNTIRSTWMGWGFLIVAGGGSYYFAKKSINAEKKARHEADVKRRRMIESLESSATSSTPPPRRREHLKGTDHAGNPSEEASSDPAPTSHPTMEAKEKSPFEPKEPYRARKGDRFS